jgi:hypothetical protein
MSRPPRQCAKLLLRLDHRGADFTARRSSIQPKISGTISDQEKREAYVGLVTALQNVSDPQRPLPLRRDSAARLGVGFTVRDGDYLSARWPGDAHRFASEFAAMID